MILKLLAPGREERIFVVESPCSCGCGEIVKHRPSTHHRKYIPGHFYPGRKLRRCPGTSRGICGYPLRTEADTVHGWCESCWDEIQIGVEVASNVG